MTPEIAAQASEPFFSTKEVDRGSGLGLRMVYGFVHQSGGYVQLSNEVAVGASAFWLMARCLDNEEALSGTPA